VPFIPREQIQHPDPEGLRMSGKVCKISLGHMARDDGEKK
jgi:hypothetical protein